MKLVLDDSGHAILKGGWPVYTDDAGREVTIDAAALTSRSGKAEHAAAVANAFMGSRFANLDAKVPADMLKAMFSDAYRLEDGKLVAYDGEGSKVYSRQRPGDVADFEESLALMVQHSKHRDFILTGTASTSDQTPTQPQQQASGFGKSMSRTAFFDMTSVQQMSHMKAGGTVHD
ncbi:MAG TPA: DUF6651 domain-containing protein [Magnetospirillum sp.]|nr:DUF6651 domain-containing protein [Magnetospirillum sp.]